MCCLSEASSHFVVFVCVNPDRKPSRKMKRLNEEAVVRALRQAQGPKGSDKRQAPQQNSHLCSLPAVCQNYSRFLSILSFIFISLHACKKEL